MRRDHDINTASAKNIQRVIQTTAPQGPAYMCAMNVGLSVQYTFNTAFQHAAYKPFRIFQPQFHLTPL